MDDTPAGILIVDDNPSNLSVLTDVLQSAGHRVRAAADGKRALRITAARAPELVLLDLQMPNMDGYELCRKLKADATTRDVPIIVISALDDVEDKVKAFEVGAVDYVTKPFQAAEVLSRVAAHLQLSRLRRELASRNDELAQRNEELMEAQKTTERVFSALAWALPGAVLDDKYELGDEIGSGGFATVFRALHLDMKREVAVKVFQPWPGNDTPQSLVRFRKEAAAACQVNHPNAISVLDSGISSSGIAYIVMELLAGVTLEDALAGAPPFQLSRCVEVMAPVCEALAEAHKNGIIHRDIKPENIFLHKTSQGEVVKVLDFGIAKLLPKADGPQANFTRAVCGTPAYLAPERLTGGAYDGRADVFAVGVILYRMLAGRLPLASAVELSGFDRAMLNVTRQPAPLSSLRPDLPPRAESLVMRALAKNPDQRPPAALLAQSLRALPEGVTA